MTDSVPTIAVRSSSGVSLWSSKDGKLDGGCYSPIEEFKPDKSKACKTMQYSPQGKYFAWTNGISVQVCNTGDWSVVTTIRRPKVINIQFSPKDNYIVTYELCITNKDTPQGSSNLNIYSIATGAAVMSLVQKRQIGWQPEWSEDESLLALTVGGEMLIYAANSEGTLFCEKPAHKIGGGKGGRISVAPGAAPVHIAYYVPGAQGQPATCRLYEYPKVDNNQHTTSKSFFQADRVEFYWNNRGSSLLLLTTTEVDQTGASYYGKQALHSLATKGDTDLVQLSKEGPIHSLAWSPKNVEFCVVYGFMPAKATLFNLKCEPVFEFGTGPKNSIYYNQLGNLLILGGFGNLQGRLEVWDAQGRKQLGATNAPDTTLLEWGPSGEVFMTATTAPRLRMANGFKIWHYTCTLLHETIWPPGEELLEVTWQRYPRGTFKEAVLNAVVKVQGIQPSEPTASTQAYRPPHARGRESTFKLHDEDEPAGRPGAPSKVILSKAALKQKKKREARRAKKQSEDPNEVVENGTISPVIVKTSVTVKDTKSSDELLTGDLERDKKIKNIKKKLEAISKLKQQRGDGKSLEVNQLAKIKTESDLLIELEALKV